MTDPFNNLPDKKKIEILDEAVVRSNRDQRELMNLEDFKQQLKKDPGYNNLDRRLYRLWLKVRTWLNI